MSDKIQKIDKIFYINLDKREDRRAEIEAELTNYDLIDKAERIEAIPRPHQGILGCTMSHLKALKLAKERDYEYVLILEDDFQFMISKEEFEKELKTLFEQGPSFHVCMISYNIQRSEPTEYSFLQKVIEAQTASGYIVHKSFYDLIIELYEWAIPLLERTGEHWNYANDQCWKRLQPNSEWYSLTTRCGRQRPSYSDNSEQFEDHNC
jgi:GR25 family glycosyltransferase involved in LPS biosynthesis